MKQANNTTQDRELFTGGDWIENPTETFYHSIGVMHNKNERGFIFEEICKVDINFVKWIDSPDEARQEAEANALLISEAKNLLKIAKRAAFLFSNENNYPEGTIGYEIWKDANEILTRITNKK